jgi:flagellar hook-basal body complex protein FliE
MSVIPNLQQAGQALNAAQTGASSAMDALAQTAGAGKSLSATGSPSYSAPFADVLHDAIAKTNELNTQAAQAVTGLLSGQGVDVHTAMIATEKSDLAFEMMLAMRNKAIGAYQQLMGMQF